MNPYGRNGRGTLSAPRRAVVVLGDDRPLQRKETCMTEHWSALVPPDVEGSPGAGSILVGGDATSVVSGGIMPHDFNTFSTPVVTNRSLVSFGPPESVRPSEGTDADPR